jgi:ATP-dependent DNA ligase
MKRCASCRTEGCGLTRWLKLQLKRSQESVIGGYTFGNPFDALIVGCYEGGELRCQGTERIQAMTARELYPLLRMLEVGRCHL